MSKAENGCKILVVNLLLQAQNTFTNEDKHEENTRSTVAGMLLCTKCDRDGEGKKGGDTVKTGKGCDW